jgi:hypothetical protein
MVVNYCEQQTHQAHDLTNCRPGARYKIGIYDAHKTCFIIIKERKEKAGGKRASERGISSGDDEKS